MKKYYYFSEANLEFVEIKNFKAKFLLYLLIFAFSLTILTFGGFILITNFTNSGSDLTSLQNENKILKNKLTELTGKYKNLMVDIGNLEDISENLRLAVNLQPISDDEKVLGIGGGSFDNSMDFIKSSSGLNLKDDLKVIDQVIRKFEFEKKQYNEISFKLNENKDLFESIPAMIPTKGEYESSSFGMRYHPILKVRKRHLGIDIVTNIGTPVYAPGKGKVVFVGRRGGYGLEMEIDHGYGYKTRYAHLSKVLVKKGQTVKRGDLVAKTGNSGLSTGPHLHYEVSHNGVKLNPARFFFGDLGFVELTQKN
ncbi:murein DD-endopeptidase MepM [bacterium BMS3Abin03]|nr:murein DD-endopeptidase MepM [bacterium BMS3Abin03]